MANDPTNATAYTLGGWGRIAHASGGTAPLQPSLTRLVNDMTGTSFTATVAPNLSNPTDPVHAVFHAQGGTPATGGNRTGNGTINVTGRTNNTWHWVEPVAYLSTDSNVKSLPGAGQWVFVHDGTNLLAASHSAVIAALRASANLAAYVTDGNWTKTDSRQHVFNRILEGWVGGRSPNRSPYVEVDMGTQTVPARRRGDNKGNHSTGTVMIRATARERDDIEGLVADIVLCLQSTANRALGDARHILDFAPVVGDVEYKHPVHQCLITLTIRFFVEQGTTV